jgi:hypothetical protein
MASESIGEDEDRRLIVERYTKGREEVHPDSDLI